MMNLKKLQFSTFSRLQTDRDKKIAQRLKELREERKSLDYDLNLIGDATRAASKITTGETPTEEENNCLEELQNNYPAFFDSDEDEEEEEESKSSSSLLGKIMVTKDYIRKEVKVNVDTAKKLQSKFKGKAVATEQDESDTEKFPLGKKDEIAGPSSQDEIAGPSSNKRSRLSGSFSSERGESSGLSSSERRESSRLSSSGKGEPSGSSSSGKGEPSGSSSQDDSFYNPFDDIGTD